MRLRVILAALAAPALATTQTVAPYGCRNGAFPGEIATVTLGRVTGPAAAPLPVFDDDRGCPQAARCRQRVPIPAGTTVLVSRREAGWACVWWARPARDEVVGWVRADRVVAAPTLGSAGLAGTWEAPAHAELTFRRDPAGALRVEGSARWQGLGDNVHEGELDGPVAVREPRPGEVRGIYRDGPDSTGCAAEFLRLGALLVAHDNGRCGGMNVRFDDVYRPAPPPRARRR